MLCTVFVIRKNGKKLPADVLKGRPNIGWLVVDLDSRKVEPREAARLYRNERLAVDVIEPMINVRVRVRKGGLLISGEEEQPGYQVQTLPQTWWCKPGAYDDLTVT